MNIDLDALQKSAEESIEAAKDVFWIDDKTARSRFGLCFQVVNPYVVLELIRRLREAEKGK